MSVQSVWKLVLADETGAAAPAPGAGRVLPDLAAADGDGVLGLKDLHRGAGGEVVDGHDDGGAVMVAGAAQRGDHDLVLDRRPARRTAFLVADGNGAGAEAGGRHRPMRVELSDGRENAVVDQVRGRKVVV